MECAVVMLMVAALGVTFGWQPAGDVSDGVEYVVQLEPELVDVLQRGESVPIESYVPAEAGPVRKVRIVVGQGDLPRTFAGGRLGTETTIVRGQNEEASESHTAHFADGWSDDRYRYDAAPAWPTTSSPNTTTASPAAAAPAPRGRPAPRPPPRHCGRRLPSSLCAPRRPACNL